MRTPQSSPRGDERAQTPADFRDSRPRSRRPDGLSWLIRRFIDANARILFVDAGRVLAVAEAEDGLPFDVPGVELGHHGERCSFDAFLDRYRLDDSALRKMALVVRGADTERPDLVPEAAGLFAIATGFQRLMPERYADDHAMLIAETPMYDALYEYFRPQPAT